MKRFTPTILALVITFIVSSTAFAGNIAGGRATGHIPAGRASGHIAIGRTAIAETSATNREVANENPSTSDIQRAFSGSFAGLIRMLFEAGALL